MNILELYASEPVAKFHSMVKAGIDEFASCLEDLKMTVKLDCIGPCVKSTHYSADKPKYEKTKSKAVHKLTELVPESRVLGVRHLLSSGKFWNSRGGLASMETVKERLHDTNCSGFIREFLFLDFGETKCRGIPKIEVDNLNEPSFEEILDDLKANSDQFPICISWDSKTLTNSPPTLPRGQDCD